VITVANRICVNPAYHGQFEARFRERAGLVDATGPASSPTMSRAPPGRANLSSS
jgi:heme-degrading monooxygenase HmoA